MIDRLVLVLLLAGCAFFSAIIAVEIGPSRDPGMTAAAASPPADASPLPPRPAPRGQYGELVAATLARPLFSSTRRPPPRNGDDKAADTGLEDTRLAGIVIAPGHRIAIFAPAGAKALVVSEGDLVSGWRVERITSRAVSLSGPDGSKTLQPKFDPNLAPPPAPVPATPPSAAAGPGYTPPVSPAASRPGLPPMLLNRPPRPGQLRGR